MVQELRRDQRGRLIQPKRESLLSADPDRSPNVVEERPFLFLLDRETQKAARLQYSVSLLCMKPDRGEANAALMNRLARLSVDLLRVTDAASYVHPSRVAVLLVGADTSSLSVIYERLREGVKLALNTTLSAGGASYPKTAFSARELVHQAVDLMARAKTAGGDRLYVP